jgi:hypothetical protein
MMFSLTGETQIVRIEGFRPRAFRRCTLRKPLAPHALLAMIAAFHEQPHLRQWVRLLARLAEKERECCQTPHRHDDFPLRSAPKQLLLLHNRALPMRRQ